MRHTIALAIAACAMLGGYVGPAFTFALITVMIIVLLFRDELTLDLEHRTYRINNCFLKRTGPFSHLKGIEIERREEHTSSAVSSGSLYVLSLVWVNGREQPWVIQQTAGMQEALEAASQVSQRLGLPVHEGERLTHFRNEIEEARLTLPKI